VTTVKPTRAPRPDSVIHSPPIVELGAVDTVPEVPVLTPPNGHEKVDKGGDVVCNHSLASLAGEGARCIAVIEGVTHLTAAEADRLGRDLVATAKIVADQRQMVGADE